MLIDTEKKGTKNIVPWNKHKIQFKDEGKMSKNQQLNLALLQYE